MTLADTAPPKVLSWNRRTYQRLKIVLSLGLRRQILMAVCDDFKLRNRIAEKLHKQLGSSQIVNLHLNLNEPNVVAQIAQWLAQHRQLKHSSTIYTFQILGVELLTRQSASVQGLFLRNLQRINRDLSKIDHNILLWLPKPWFQTIEESAPEFWRSHTGMFEFEGEPTPVPQINHKFVVEPFQIRQEIPVIQENAWDIINNLNKLAEVPLKNPDLEDDFAQQLVPQEPPTHPTIGKSPPEADTTQLQISSEATEIIVEQPTVINQQVSSEVTTLTPEQAASSEAIKAELVASLQALEEILQDEQSVSPLVLAEAYLRLGNYYRDLIDQGEVTPDTLIPAIQAYEQGIKMLETAQADPTLIAEDEKLAEPLTWIPDLLNDLGNLYWLLSLCPKDIEQKLYCLEKAIESYQLALVKIYAENAPETYAMIQNNIGAAHADLALYRDPVENIGQSIRAYEEALRFRSPQIDPIKYASTQNNLGTAYWNLAQHQQAFINLKLAIAAYDEALQHYQPEQEPLNWAMIQNNLGTAYWNLAQYEQPEEFLHLAIAAYEQSLQYRRADVAPSACAATQNNLGTAYWHLAIHSQAKPEAQQLYGLYLQLCILAYETAIAISQELANAQPPISVNFDLFATYNNLGLAQYQLGMDVQSLSAPEKQSYLKAALNSHLRALEGFVEQPDNYKSALSYIIRTIRAFYSEYGISGQNLALSLVPGHLIPKILRQL